MSLKCIVVDVEDSRLYRVQSSFITDLYLWHCMDGIGPQG